MINFISEASSEEPMETDGEAAAPAPAPAAEEPTTTAAETPQEAAPTDGLFGDNRTDEDQIGANYDELEWAMKAVEKGQISKDFSGREREVMEIYEKRHRDNLHKMIAIPICEIPREWK